MDYFENDIFTPDISDNNTHRVFPRVVMDKSRFTVIEAINDESERASAFSADINNSVIGDFERENDKMCHVSTFCFVDNYIYVSYYASANSGEENPDYQSARLAYAPKNDYKSKTVIDVLGAGDTVNGHKVHKVYDTILMQRDDEKDKLYVLFTAFVDVQYYRLYRVFDINTKALGQVEVNRFSVCGITNDFSTSGMQNALAYSNIGYKPMHTDIGIMQKLSSRVENGKRYYYSGAYSGHFTCIIKSTDLITWEYVSQPNEDSGAFENDTLWENATYVIGSKVYYFIRQWNDSGLYGILTCYDLDEKRWAKPVLVGDCQSRGDFILYKNELYLFHAPIDRNHIGILHVNQQDIEKSNIVLQADMKGSCFYPFVQYGIGGETLCMSYTVDRKHIRISSFDLSKYTT